MPSFPGAEGFGGTFAGTMPATGWFTGGSVYHVTTTEDLLDGSGRPVQGTLRGAFWNYSNPSQPKQNASNRIVVFDGNRRQAGEILPIHIDDASSHTLIGRVRTVELVSIGVPRL